MLTPLSSAFRSALPLTLVFSPLLMAAAQPTDLKSPGIVCNASGAAGQSTQQQIAQPISTRSQALVTSEQELSAFSNTVETSAVRRRWNTALRLILSNPYSRNDATSAEGGSVPDPAAGQNDCIATVTSAEVAPAETPFLKNASRVSSGANPAAKPSTNRGSLATKEVDLLPVFDEPAMPSLSPANLPPVPPARSPVAAPSVAEPEPSSESESLPAVQPPVVRPIVVPVTPTVPTPQPSTPAPLSANPPAGSPFNRMPSLDPNNVTPTTVNPTVFDGSVVSTLSSKPDGNYRYLAGETEARAYTHEELQQRGDAIFLLKKEGNRVTGSLVPRLDSPGICVTGIVSGDTITGSAYPQRVADPTQAIAPTTANDIANGITTPYGGALQIRRPNIASGIANGDATDGGMLYYATAVLNLSGFSSINAGASLPPTSCLSEAATVTSEATRDATGDQG